MADGDMPTLSHLSHLLLRYYALGPEQQATVAGPDGDGRTSWTLTMRTRQIQIGTLWKAGWEGLYQNQNK